MNLVTKKHLFSILALLALGFPTLWATDDASKEATISLDHVQVAVSDYEGAGAFFKEKLGFTIKEGIPHDNTLNSSYVKFRDQSYLSLSSATAAKDFLSSLYVNYLKDGEGGYWGAFQTTDILATAEKIKGTGLDFRVYGNPEGRAILSGAPKDPLHHVFFIHLEGWEEPEEVLTHANTATGLGAIWIAVNKKEQAMFSSAMAAAIGSDNFTETAPEGVPAATGQIKVGENHVFLLDRPENRNRIMGVTVLVQDIEKAKSSIYPSLSPTIEDTSRGKRILLKLELGGGFYLEYLQTK